MPIRFYVDADMLGLGKILASVRSDVTYPGDPGGPGAGGEARPPCPLEPGVKDPSWIPVTAAEGWIAITRDRHLRHRPDERRAILEHGARVVRLEAREALNKWGQLEIVVYAWRRIEDQLIDLPGPWVYVATRTGIRRESLEP
jgi:hypothetical protein